MPVDDQVDLALRTANEEEPKTHADKITDVLIDVDVTDAVLSIADEVPEVQSAPAAPKAKAKRVSQKRTCFQNARNRGDFFARRSAS